MMLENKTKSLLQLFNESLIHLSSSKNYFNKVEDFITNDSKCAYFINHILYNDKDFYKNNPLYISKGRAKHSVISYFLGNIIGQFENLFANCSNILEINNNYLPDINEPYINGKLWLICSTNHDYGYFTKLINKPTPIKNLPIDYNLLDDTIDFDYSFLRNYEEKYVKSLKYSYEDIKNYYNYAQEFHSKKSDYEINDHGIIGGLILYDKIIKFFKYSKDTKTKTELSMNVMEHEPIKNDILYYKSCCLTICQHNIFKSNNSESDKLYTKHNLLKLLHDSNFKIGFEHPLLLLLSLVDTIEFTKKFNKNNQKKIRTLTLLKNIEMYVDTRTIIISFKKLIKKYNSNNYVHKTILNLIDNDILNLPHWTVLQVTKKEDFVISIQKSY